MRQVDGRNANLEGAPRYIQKRVKDRIEVMIQRSEGMMVTWIVEHGKGQLGGLDKRGRMSDIYIKAWSC
jgi:hypothetical protein